ncbi:MAG: hypothetical protein PHE67_02285 [Campylobacterales bacterium]|nr:hypothetical protein [Campylobacterales bacterium]
MQAFRKFFFLVAMVSLLNGGLLANSDIDTLDSSVKKLENAVNVLSQAIVEIIKDQNSIDKEQGIRDAKLEALLEKQILLEKSITDISEHLNIQQNNDKDVDFEDKWQKIKSIKTEVERY